jgi:hypothetical protein
MVKFVVTEKGIYKFTSDTLKAFISTSTNPSDVPSYVCGFTGIAELEPGTYYICVGNNDIRGEFTVTATKEEGDVELPVKNEIVVGDNHYVISDALLATGFEFLQITITEPGTYVVTGGAPMKVYFFTVPVEILAGDEPFGWNVDTTYESGFAPYFTVTLGEAGTYWMGFNYDFVTEDSAKEYDITIELHAEHSFEAGKCTVCGEKDPEFVPPHEHEFVEGKCECGETDPEYVAPEQPPVEEPEMNFFQKLIAWFMDLIQKLLAMFKK